MPRTRIPLIQVNDVEWETLCPVDYTDTETGLRFQLPARYRFDLASVPRGFWWLIAPFELSTLAPLIHDWLYEHKGRVRVRRVTRRESDRIFLRIMRHEGIGRTRRTLAYMAVRAFGWIYWNRRGD